MNPERLEIFIITYNRCSYLERTLQSLFDEKCPVRNYSITVLDNNSTDGTGKLCTKFATKHHNLTYVKNHRNVGLSGNICKAMELASKEYFWIMCDNDDLDFSAWSEVEKAMDEKADLILAAIDYFEPEKEKKCFEALVLDQLTFLPAGIYRTEHLTDNVMSYAVADTYTVLPHLPLGCAIINKKGKIVRVSKGIVTLTNNVKIEKIIKYDFDRIKPDPYIHKNVRTMSNNFYAGIVTSFDACFDRKIRNQAIINFTQRLNGFGPYLSFDSVFYLWARRKTHSYIVHDFCWHLPKTFRRISYLKFLAKSFIYLDITKKRVKLRIFRVISIPLYRKRKAKGK